MNNLVKPTRIPEDKMKLASGGGASERSGGVVTVSDEVLVTLAVRGIVFELPRFMKNDVSNRVNAVTITRVGAGEKLTALLVNPPTATVRGVGAPGKFSPVIKTWPPSTGGTLGIIPVIVIGATAGISGTVNISSVPEALTVSAGKESPAILIMLFVGDEESKPCPMIVAGSPTIPGLGFMEFIVGWARARP